MAHEDTQVTPLAGEERLVRGLGLKEATALNMIDMVGVGPFITIPLILAAMAGPQAMLGWLVGALLALCDGLVWAQLGAAMPHAGGTYVFLREAYGPQRWGRLLSFLFIWQMLFRAPLSMASGLIGFADYADYAMESFGWQSLVAADGGRTLEHRLLAGGVGLFIVFLLYRRITTIGKISLYLWVVVFGTIAWIIFGGITHFNAAVVFDFPPGAFDFWQFAFYVGLGNAMLVAIYDYLGYQNVCYLGAEIRDPVRVIPRAIIISILAIAALYFVMNLSLISVIPWREALTSKYIVSTFMERLYGPLAGQIVTGLILVAAFASVWSLMLGYSRIPYAAALDGGFFRLFARVHPTKQFPHISLLAVGAVTVAFSLLFKLREVIVGLMAIRILIEFVAQAVAILVLQRKGMHFPFRMWLYPLPALAAIGMWLWLFLATGWFILIGLGVLLLGLVVYLVRARVLGEFPFTPARASNEKAKV
ncbi:MAG TPA: APC family permease [Candidatus Acidoferrales bacterium]|nr:APC family permease [Candidatus Acidoferrales bacterium]